MKSTRIVLGHHVKQERIGIVVKRFMIEKQFGKQTQILGVTFVFTAVYLEE